MRPADWMLEFLSDELMEREKRTFKKIVSMHFGSRGESADAADLVKRVVSWIEQDAKLASEERQSDAD